MEFREAVLDDLEELKGMYGNIVANMNENNIPIWDDVYPCAFLEDDIKRQQLYVLRDEAEILAAFALCDSNAGEKEVKWKQDFGKAVYLDRFGVNIRYGNKGIGTFMLEKARELAQFKGFDWLRLFVVDINIPAIRLYVKNGFMKAEGIYEEAIEEAVVLREYGYEIKV